MDITIDTMPNETSATAFYGENAASNVGRSKYGMDSLQNVAFLPKVTFDYTPGGNFLDLEAGETYSDKKEIEQNYTFTQSGDTTYTDVTKVKLTWTVTDIAATYTSTKTWKPDTMTWDETKTAGTTTNGGATFTLTNLSSVKVNASASFKAESGFTPKTVKIGGAEITADANGVYTGSAVTIGTVVKDDKTVDATIDHDEIITAAITPGDNDFASLAAGSGKYGTYTVTLSAAPTVVAKCLAFIANEDNSSITPSFASGTFQYSTDGGANWTDGVSGTEIKLAKAGDTVMMKGTNCTTDINNHFAMTGSISAEGDITSLTNGKGGDVNLAKAYPNLEESYGCYQYMFYDCSALTNAPALPSTVLGDNCYEDMFRSCANLTVAPTLPAKTMAYNCYANMFAGCTSLKTAPELPAKTLAENCYRSMFYDCSALMSAPKLPATDLAKNCYAQMFYGCTWLFETPELPATILPNGCYSSMFTESGIKTITALPEIESYGTDCLNGMFYACPNLLVQEGGTMPEGGGKIFTCTTENESGEVYRMFATGVSPTNGTTYYYQPNNAVYRIEIVLENCQIQAQSTNLNRFLTVTKGSTVANTTIEKIDGYNIPDTVAVIGGLAEESAKLKTPSKQEIMIRQYLKNCVYLTITLTDENGEPTITGDATITVTAVQQ